MNLLFQAILITYFALIHIPSISLASWTSKSKAIYSEVCIEQLSQLPKPLDKNRLKKLCGRAIGREQCKSVWKQPIFSFDFPTKANEPKKILVIAVIHGDEGLGGTVANRWMERLTRIKSRNHWRVIPLLNPDGLQLATRMNARGVDINRNFPSKDWKHNALRYWRGKKNSDPRRYPGPAGASEPETQCVLNHINDFDPDFMVAIHTPYGVLDFDGPKIKFPRFSDLPWRSLGTFPGSLGRYLWVDNRIPVLTVELRNEKLLQSLDSIHKLQDITGTVAIRSNQSIIRTGK